MPDPAVLCHLLAHHLDDQSLPVWPLTWGVPLAPGRLPELGALAVADEAGRRHPAQGRVLARHADGSIRQLLVDAELPLQRDHEHHFALLAAPAPLAAPAASAGTDALIGAAGALRLADGALTFHRPDGDLALELTASDVSTRALPCTWLALEPFAPGPIAAAAVVQGELRLAGEHLARLRLTARVYAQTPLLACDLELRVDSDHPWLELRELRLAFVPAGAAWRDLRYELRHLGGPHQAALPFEARSERLTLTAGEHRQESRLLNYNETWLSLDDGATRCTLAIRDFLECYPYGVTAAPRQLALECWPAWGAPHAPLRQGTGKTHSFALGWSPADQPAWPAAFGYAVGKPPLTRVAWADLQVADRFADLLPYLPETYPRLETTLYDIVYNRNRGFGKLNYGDDYSALYTNQGRGQGRLVWNNLEGDYPYHLFCQFQRTGHYLYWKEFLTGIRHWADVDFRDRHPEPLQAGALVVHSRGHNSGICSPCHNWAEGFREWYFATGDPRPLEILGQMADWLLRLAAAGRFQTTPRPYVRGCGWGLIQLAAIHEVLPRDDLAALMTTLCHDLLAYCRAEGGLPMVIPTGGSHVPRDNAFHSATVVMGAERCWRRLGDPAMRELALAAAEVFMDRRTCTPEGIAVYISGPEQDFPMQQAATFALAALATAYRLSGEVRFVRRGMRMLEYCLDRGMIVDHMRIPGEFVEVDGELVLVPQLLMPNTQLSSYQLRGLLQFMKPAHEAGLLRAVDYHY
jgi:hypothetical protein